VCFLEWYERNGIDVEESAAEVNVTAQGRAGDPSKDESALSVKVEVEVEVTSKDPPTNEINTTTDTSATSKHKVDVDLSIALANLAHNVSATESFFRFKISKGIGLDTHYFKDREKIVVSEV
jgi:hypothetical protein